MISIILVRDIGKILFHVLGTIRERYELINKGKSKLAMQAYHEVTILVRIIDLLEDKK